MPGEKISQSLGNESGVFYGYYVVLASFLMMSAIWAVYYAFGVFFKPMLNEFGLTKAMTSGAFSLGSVITGLSTIAMGRLTDRLGPRMVMSFCGLLLGLGFILMSQISSVLHLYLFYGLLVGTGTSGSFIPLTSTIARWFFKKRGLMTGIVAVGSGIGGLIGPSIASRLIPIYGWRVSYAILGTLVLSVVLLFAQFIKKDPAQIGRVAYGENQTEKKGLNLRGNELSLREALYTSPFWIFSSTGFCYGYCLSTMMVHITPHAIELGISSISATNILAAIGGFGILGKVSLGRTGDIIGSKKSLILGFVLMLAALGWLVQAKMAWTLFSIAGIFGFAYGGCAVSQSPIIAELFGLRSHGLIYAAFDISVKIGGAIGPLLTGYIFDATNNYQIAFLLCAAISFTGIVLTSFLKIGRGTR